MSSGVTNKNNKPAKVTCEFHEFFGVWAQMQSPTWEIPDFHIDMLEFLAGYKTWEKNRALIQVFRGASKSTMVGLWIAWMLTQDPTLRFLIISLDHDTAEKIPKDVAGIITRHPFATHLHSGSSGHGKRKKTWRTDRIDVVGANDPRNPSVRSKSIESNLTGGRADVIIYDDVEGPDNSATDYKRNQLREKLDEPTHVLVPGGYELFVGTPHSFDSIYTEIEGTSGKAKCVRKGCSQIKIPILTDIKGEYPHFTGVSKWPARFTDEAIQDRQLQSHTKGHFLSQYLLQPYNPAETVLDPSLIATYTHELKVHAANGASVAVLGDQRVVGYSAFWDPAMGTGSSDDSVLAIVFQTGDGLFFIHAALKITGDANAQCAQVIQHMRESTVSHVVIESNGVGSFLPFIFRKEAEGKGVTCEGKATTQNKAQKIMHAFDTNLSSGRLHAHKSVMEGPFRVQLRDFSTKNIGRHKDDFIDAVAAAILAQPIRIKAGHYGSRTSLWNAAGSEGSLQVDMDPISL